MSFHIRDDFKTGAPVSQVPASWFNAVGGIINRIAGGFINMIVGGFGIKTPRGDSGKIMISLDKEVLQKEIDNAVANIRVSKDPGTPVDKSDTNPDDYNDGAHWSWISGGTKGLIITPYCVIEQEDGWHYFGRAKMTYSKDGLLISAEGLTGRKEIQS